MERRCCWIQASTPRFILVYIPVSPLLDLSLFRYVIFSSRYLVEFVGRVRLNRTHMFSVARLTLGSASALRSVRSVDLGQIRSQFRFAVAAMKVEEEKALSYVRVR